MHLLPPDTIDQDNQLPLFELQKVSFSYPDGHKALHEVSLKIFYGDRIALVGQNGAGKSSLVRQLNGLHVPDSGTILYKGEALSRQNLRLLRMDIGLLFEDPDNHLFCSTLYDDIAFGPMNQGLPENLVRQRVEKALQETELSHLIYKPAHTLSYGQKKRAAFAAIMAMNPSVLVLDEPSSNLDPWQEKIVKKLLHEFTGTLICINHDMLFLYGLCNRAVVLAHGHIHHDYGFDDLFLHQDSLREHGLDFTFRFSCCQHGHNHPHSEISVKKGEESGETCEETTPALITLEDYHYTFPDGTSGLNGVTLAINRGDSVALVGQNGAGKSTLASVLLGLYQGRGHYLFNGRQVTSSSRPDIWKKVGMVFQNSADQLFCPSCREEVCFGPRQLGCSHDEIESRLAEVLGLVKMSGYEDRVPLHLSSGERKRLAIAAALSMQPEVLILDEPTAGLDPQGEELLLEIIRQLPLTILLISHDIYFVQALTSRTVVLHQGEIIRDYQTRDFLNDEHLESINHLDFTYKNSCSEKILQVQKAAEGRNKESHTTQRSIYGPAR